MKKWIILNLVLGLFVTSLAWAESSDQEAARSVVESWFSAMKDNQVDKAASYLAPQFVSIHTDGIVRNKAQEIELIKKLQMKKYQLTDFKYSQSNNTMVVTYKDETIEKIDNKEVGKHAAGRMAVLQKDQDKWLILAYANLDTIG